MIDSFVIDIEILIQIFNYSWFAIFHLFINIFILIRDYFMNTLSLILT